MRRERWLALGHFRWQPELTVYTHGCLRKRPACRRALERRAICEAPGMSGSERTL
jgi:hypothetical protein